MNPLEKLLDAAHMLSGDNDRGGMADVNILYHPYEATWIAKVSWSSGMEEVVKNDDVMTAIAILTEKLLVQ